VTFIYTHTHQTFLHTNNFGKLSLLAPATSPKAVPLAPSLSLLAVLSSVEDWDWDWVDKLGERCLGSVGEVLELFLPMRSVLPKDW